jgi:hypothetical protein
MQANRAAWARRDAALKAAAAARLVTCPHCHQKVDTRDPWDRMVPGRVVFVIHLVAGLYCPGSREPAVRDADALGVAP